MSLLLVVLGSLVLLTAAASLGSWTALSRPGGPGAFLLGATSGILGCLTGYRGGLRAAALDGCALVTVATVGGVAGTLLGERMLLWPLAGRNQPSDGGRGRQPRRLADPQSAVRAR